MVAAELAGMGAGGKLAVIAPTARIGELARALPDAVPGESAEVLDSPVALLTVGQAKGLEFDRVVLVDPAGIWSESRPAATTSTSPSPAPPIASPSSTTATSPQPSPASPPTSRPPPRNHDH